MGTYKTTTGPAPCTFLLLLSETVILVRVNPLWTEPLTWGTISAEYCGVATVPTAEVQPPPSLLYPPPASAKRKFAGLDHRGSTSGRCHVKLGNRSGEGHLNQASRGVQLL